MKMRLSISRKINTAAYENIVISVDIERDCGDGDEAEFKKSIRADTIAAYKTAEEQVLSELNLGEKFAHQESKPASQPAHSMPRKHLTDKDLEGII
jgi:hypothetical protein